MPAHGNGACKKRVRQPVAQNRRKGVRCEQTSERAAEGSSLHQKDEIYDIATTISSQHSGSGEGSIRPSKATSSCSKELQSSRHRDSDVNLSPQGTRAIPLTLNPVPDKESAACRFKSFFWSYFCVGDKQQLRAKELNPKQAHEQRRRHFLSRHLAKAGCYFLLLSIWVLFSFSLVACFSFFGKTPPMFWICARRAGYRRRKKENAKL